MSENTTYTTQAPHVKRLERSTDSKVLAGVAGGLGRYFDLTPNVFRLGFVVLTLLGGAGILVYLAAFLVMPAQGEDASIAERVLAERRDHPGRLVALALVGFAILVLISSASTWPSAGAGWVLVLIAGLVILWATRAGRSRGVLVAVVTVVALALATIAAAAVAAFSWFDVSLDDGVGKRTYAPATVVQVRDSYELGVGNLKLDLSNVPVTRDLDVKASVGVGELRVVVPRDASVVVDAHVKAGSISSLDGREDDGTNVRVVVGDAAGGLHVDADVGAGHIDVVRGG